MRSSPPTREEIFAFFDDLAENQVDMQHISKGDIWEGMRFIIAFLGALNTNHCALREGLYVLAEDNDRRKSEENELQVILQNNCILDIIFCSFQGIETRSSGYAPQCQ